MGAHFMNVPDYTGNQAYANKLAGRIKAYWNARGKYPQVWVEELFDGFHGNGFVVRSNIRGGIVR
jgi:hypothetical protein